jgi:hypothetical protein
MSAIVAEPMSTSRLDPVPLRVEHTDEMVVVLTVGRPLLGPADSGLTYTHDCHDPLQRAEHLATTS